MGFVANSLLPSGVGWLDSLIGIAVGGGLFLVIILVSGGGMGGGDMKLGAMLGAFLGWKLGLLALLLGVLAGGAVAVVLLLLGRRAGRKRSHSVRIWLSAARWPCSGVPKFSRGTSAASSRSAAPREADVTAVRFPQSPHRSSLTRPLADTCATAGRWRLYGREQPDSPRPSSASQGEERVADAKGLALFLLDTMLPNTMRRPHAGYSLVEILLVVSMIGIMTALATPMFLRYYQGAQLRLAAEEVATFLNQGRQLAIMQNGSICVHIATTTMHYHQGSCAGATWVGPGTNAAGKIAVPAGITLATTADPIFNYLGGTYHGRDLHDHSHAVEHAGPRRGGLVRPGQHHALRIPALASPVIDRRGITLVEVIVAVGIITVGLSALLAAVPFASYGTREGYQLSTATFLANERLEQVRNARWESEPRAVDDARRLPRTHERPRERRRHHVRGRGRAARALRRLRARRPDHRLRRRVQRDREARSPAGHDHRDLPPDDRRRRRRHREGRGRHDTHRQAMTVSTSGRSARAVVSPFESERGVALPMALLSLVVIAALILGFSVLSAIEPTIANNQLAVAQARALAEAGVERALWALSNPADAQGIPATFTTPPSPYDGGRLMPVAAGGYPVGGFRVTVTNGSTAYERQITAVGFVPDDTTAGRRAIQKITVTALNPQLIVKDPPAALSVQGELRASGTLRVDSRTDGSCGPKVGTLARGETSLDDASADIRGAGGDGTARNRITDAAGGLIPATAGDIVKNASASVFDAFSLSDADLNALRAFAKVRGTYLQGAVRFGAGNRMPDGIIVVDGGRVPPSDLASVAIDAGAPADPSGVWRGWLIVNGSLAVAGEVQLRGFVYAQSTLDARAAGAVTLGRAGEPKHPRSPRRGHRHRECRRSQHRLQLPRCRDGRGQNPGALVPQGRQLPRGLRLMTRGWRWAGPATTLGIAVPHTTTAIPC